MPYPFALPTTSAFSFSTVFACPTHPSLLHNATTYRSVVRDTLKKHKRLPPESQAANLSLVVSSLHNYLAYLTAVMAGLGGGRGVRVEKRVVAGSGSAPRLPEWRPILSESRLPGREPPRVRIVSLEHELAFALATLGLAYSLQARAALQPLYVATSVVPVGPQQRQAAITGSTRHLLDAAAVFALASNRALTSEAAVPASTPGTSAAAVDITPAVLRAQSSLALAEATLLAVLKDDPYPAVVAANRNEYDREWMYKAPSIPKVRAHLFARLCLAAAEHAGTAAASAASSSGRHHQLSLNSAYLRYLQNLQHTSRAKACRFFAIDADLSSQTGTALAWLNAALRELGSGDGVGGSGGGGSEEGGGPGRDAGGGSGSGSGNTGTSSGTSSRRSKASGLIGRLRKDRSEKREDRRVERSTGWGADAGRFEETRVAEMLHAKWTKQNDTMNPQIVPASGPLLAQMPSGREIHTLKPFELPVLDTADLETMRAPPPESENALADDDGASSSDDEPAPGSAYY